MNEIHIRGRVKNPPWTYDGNLYVRVSLPRERQRPGRSPEAGGSFDYLTVLFPGGARQGLELRRGQWLTVHGWLQSRDVQESLAEFLSRTNGAAAQLQVDPRLGEEIRVHHSVTEVVAERWTVEAGQDQGRRRGEGDEG